MSQDEIKKARQPWKKSDAGGMVVPAGFEGVTELGSAKQVFMVERGYLSGYMIALGIGLGIAAMGLIPAGISMFASTSEEDVAGLLFAGLIPLVIGGGLMLLGVWKLVVWWMGVQAVVTYQDGFAFRKRGSISAWAWSEIASILSKERLHVNSRGSSSTSLSYVVAKKDGETVTLSKDQLQDISKLIDTVKRRAFAVMLPTYQQAYQSDQPVTFGAVTVSKPDGLTAEGRQFAWSDITDVKVKHGKLEISTKQAGVLGGVHSVRASKIPNIEILCQLIGIDPWSINLTYI